MSKSGEQPRNTNEKSKRLRNAALGVGVIAVGAAVGIEVFGL